MLGAAVFERSRDERAHGLRAEGPLAGLGLGEEMLPANGELQLPGAEPQQPSPLMLGCVARDLTGLSDGGQATFSSGGG